MDTSTDAISIFGEKTTFKVLRHILTKPNARIYLAQILRELRISKVSGIKALVKLTKSGILKYEQLGRTKLYSLNNESPLVKELKRVLSISYVTYSFRNFDLPNCEVYLFGSAARGENDEKSDYDVLIITDQTEEARVQMQKIEDEKLKMVFFTRIGYASLYRKDRPFYERVEKDRIRLV